MHVGLWGSKTQDFFVLFCFVFKHHPLEDLWEVLASLKNVYPHLESQRNLIFLLVWFLRVVFFLLVLPLMQTSPKKGKDEKEKKNAGCL